MFCCRYGATGAGAPLSTGIALCAGACWTGAGADAAGAAEPLEGTFTWIVLGLAAGAARRAKPGHANIAISARAASAMSANAHPAELSAPELSSIYTVRSSEARVDTGLSITVAICI